MSETSQAPYFIHLDQVRVHYSLPTGGIKTVLNGVDLRVRDSEFVTLVGPSGCGKSTLLRLILGSERPKGGTVHIDGAPVAGPGRERGIVFQRYSLFPHLTVLQNIAFGLDLERYSTPGRLFLLPWYRAARKRFAAEAREYLERVGLGEAADKYPHQLSGGMRQRVAIAQAAIMKPKVLLMDEPFGALDDATRQEMQLFILEFWEKTKTTIFFVTHDLEEALFLGSRILVLSQYYTAEEPTEGAKLVIDREVPGGYPKPTQFKYSPEFNELLSQVRRDGLDPQIRQHVDEFDLSHRDAGRRAE